MYFIPFPYCHPSAPVLFCLICEFFLLCVTVKRVLLFLCNILNMCNESHLIFPVPLSVCSLLLHIAVCACIYLHIVTRASSLLYLTGGVLHGDVSSSLPPLLQCELQTSSKSFPQRRSSAQPCADCVLGLVRKPWSAHSGRSHQALGDVHISLWESCQVSIQTGCQCPLPPEGALTACSDFFSLKVILCWGCFFLLIFRMLLYFLSSNSLSVVDIPKISPKLSAIYYIVHGGLSYREF